MIRHHFDLLPLFQLSYIKKNVTFILKRQIFWPSPFTDLPRKRPIGDGPSKEFMWHCIFDGGRYIWGCLPSEILNNSRKIFFIYPTKATQKFIKFVLQGDCSAWLFQGLIRNQINTRNRLKFYLKFVKKIYLCDIITEINLSNLSVLVYLSKLIDTRGR